MTFPGPKDPWSKVRTFPGNKDRVGTLIKAAIIIHCMVHLGPLNLLSAACMTILFLQITLSFRQANGEKSCLMTICPVTVPFFQCHLNLPFLKYLYLEIWPWKSKVKVMGSKVKVMYRSNSSVLRWQLINEANLKDLIAATGLVILLELDSNCRFFGQCDLEIQWMT